MSQGHSHYAQLRARALGLSKSRAKKRAAEETGRTKSAFKVTFTFEILIRKRQSGVTHFKSTGVIAAVRRSNSNAMTHMLA